LYYDYYKKNNLGNILNGEEFMTLSMWNYYESGDHNVNTSYKIILKNPLKILTNDYFTEEFKIYINNNINNRIKKINSIIKCYITAVVTSEEGINGLRNVLDISEYEKQYDGIKLTINMETPPKYSIQIEGANLEYAIEISNNIIKNMQTVMEKYTGYVDIIEQPIIIKEEEFELRFISDNILKQLLE
jgi:translation initiation factor 2 alpha subunit (eIF-2alpha)